SEDLCVVAVAATDEVGVDLEHMSPHIDYQSIADSFFSTAEARAIRSLPQPQGRSLFYNLWTCKEACLKCSGEGLRVPLDQIVVQLRGQSSPCTVRHGASEWSCVRVAPQPQYTAAIALSGYRRGLVCEVFVCAARCIG